MTDFSILLKKRRSIRDYEDKGVSLETIKEIIRESCLAPSSGNGQPWRFIIINDKAMIKILSDESKRNLLADLEKNAESPSKKYEEYLRDPDFNVFYNAPCLVYLVGHKDVRSLDVDCALAASYFMFSALEKGLGTCWIGLGKFIHAPDLRHLIGIPDDCRIVAPIIIGYPKAIPDLTDREAPRILKIVS
jgi:nitroreductase